MWCLVLAETCFLRDLLIGAIRGDTASVSTEYSISSSPKAWLTVRWVDIIHEQTALYSIELPAPRAASERKAHIVPCLSGCCSNDTARVPLTVALLYISYYWSCYKCLALLVGDTQGTTQLFSCVGSGVI